MFTLLSVLPLYFSRIPQIVFQNSQVDLKIPKLIKNQKLLYNKLGTIILHALIIIPFWTVAAQTNSESR